MKKKENKDIFCPLCGQGSSVGSLKANNAKRFFCNECAIEFFITPNEVIKIYTVTESGALEKFQVIYSDGTIVRHIKEEII